MIFPRATESIYAISPYIGGDVTPPGFVRRVVLASNENPYGPSPLVKDLVQGYTDRLHCYPSGGANLLREAIGKTYDLDPTWIATGNGSEDMLHLLTRVFAQASDEILIAQHGFGVYKIATMAVGATPVEVPRVDFKLHVADILERVTDKTKILFLDHPGNPIAHYLEKAEIEELLSKLPSQVLVVLDAAYAEYMESDTYHCGTDWVKRFQNVVMTRSFSKAYGMANLRLGWLYAQPEIIDPISRVRPPFNTTGISQEAGIAALSDQPWIEKCVRYNREALAEFLPQIQSLSTQVLPFSSNFVMAYFENTQAVYQYLGKNGFIVRPMGAYNLEKYLRISIGKPEEMQEFIDILKLCPTL